MCILLAESGFCAVSISNRGNLHPGCRWTKSRCHGRRGTLQGTSLMAVSWGVCNCRLSAAKAPAVVPAPFKPLAASAVLLAETVATFFPKLVELHNYR